MYSRKENEIVGVTAMSSGSQSVSQLSHHGRYYATPAQACQPLQWHPDTPLPTHLASTFTPPSLPALITYLPTYLTNQLLNRLPYLPIHLPTLPYLHHLCLPLPTHLLSYLPTYLTNQLANRLPYLPIHLKTLPYLHHLCLPIPTYLLSYLPIFPNYLPIYPSTTYLPPTYNLPTCLSYLPISYFPTNQIPPYPISLPTSCLPTFTSLPTYLLNYLSSTSYLPANQPSSQPLSQPVSQPFSTSLPPVIIFLFFLLFCYRRLSLFLVYFFRFFVKFPKV